MAKHKIAIVRLFILLITASLILTLSGVGQAAVSKAPPAPTVADGMRDGTPGTIYYGAIPPGGGTSKPVLLFVHGLHGEGNKWWTGGNDSYNLAYNAGYRTAFVDLNGGGSIWNNGQLLAGQINTILGRYGVSGLNVIAHSKGGLDTNSAIVHYGASGKVQNFAQLSSPNWGSQLADLSYSWWAGWLATILGQRDDAVYSLQTGQMASFRSLSDSRAENNGTHYLSSGATSWGSIFGALFYGGLYLNSYGPNDGAVTVASAHHPLATWMFTDSNLNHDGISVGRNYWSRVEPNVRTLWHGEAGEGQAEAFSPYAAIPAGSILRGGPLTGRVAESFPVESGAKAINVAVLTGSGASVSLRDASGRAYQPNALTGSSDGVFKGATSHIFTISSPAAGNWQLQVSAASNLSLNRASSNAYLMVAEVQSGLKVSLRSQSKETTFQPDVVIGFGLEATDGGSPLSGLSVESHLAAQTDSSSGLADGSSVNLTMPGAEGIHNLSLTVRGSDHNGYPFERSLTTSFAVR